MLQRIADGTAAFIDDAKIASTSENTPVSLAESLLRGSSALGVATVVERGLAFIANLAAARIGGVHIFGAYSVAMTTANNIASYAGAGIGTTANRFSGDYPYGSAGYRGLLRTLTFVSLGSAAVAVGVLWLTGRWLATYVIGNAALAPLLRIAALSAGAAILLECLRGLLVGQRRFTALLVLSVLVGVGLAVFLPVSVQRSTSLMVLTQAGVVFFAVALCTLGARKLKFAPPRTGLLPIRGPKPLEMIRFGVVQLAGVVGINVAGWWVASLVARADVSLAQSGWYSVATQMRNICSMPAWLISQTAYAHLTKNGARHYGGAARVTVVSTVAASAIALAVTGFAAMAVPWLLPRLYGHDFANAELAATLALSTALIHMSAAPAAARLTVVSLPMTGLINGVWSALLIGLGTWLIPMGGAAQATGAFLAAHLFSAIAVLVALAFLDSASRDLAIATVPSLAGSILLSLFGWMRSTGLPNASANVAILATTMVLLFLTLRHARQMSIGFTQLRLHKFFVGLRDRWDSFHNRNMSGN